MNPKRPFGRRTAPPGGPSVDPLSLDEAAEAFRRELKAAPPPPNGFLEWRRRQGGVALWSLRLALIVPGLLTKAFGAPAFLSGLLALAGLVIGGLIRKERQRRLKAIAAWDPDAPALEEEAVP